MGAAGGFRIARAARLRLNGFSGLTRYPSAAQRLARWMSAGRSSSIRTFTFGSLPELSSSRSDMRHGHATHRPDLQIEHHQIGCALLDHIGNIATVAAHGERHVWAAERGSDVIEDMIGVGSHQDVHGDDPTGWPARLRNR